MDMKLPGIDGIVTTARIRRAHPEVQIVALSSFHEQEMVDSAYRAGVNSYVLKASAAHDLVNAIRTAAPRKPLV